MQVIKRDGKKVEFDPHKIEVAILKAFAETRNESNDDIRACAKRISSEIAAIGKDISVEEIQDIVEEKLMGTEYKDVAKAYVEYRYRHKLIREFNTTDQSIKELLNGESDYWNSENSNKNARVVTTQRDYIAGITSTDISRRLLLPKDVVEAHDAGIIHFHDIDYFAQRSLHNCFDRSTRFITSKGVKSFNDFNEGDHVLVMTHTGAWKDAVVIKYGQQELYRIVLKQDESKEREVLATRNHRWILHDGSVTTDLQLYDVIYQAPESATPYVNTCTTDDITALTILKEWTVVAIDYAKTDNVWCLQVEDDHSFILEGGIVTGNCELVNLEDVLQNGTVLNGVMIRKPHRLLTATTIATQVITAVTSSSYGGCTINLSHLAPFVRDSYNLHYKKYVDRGCSEADAEKWANMDLRKEVTDSVQTFNYQVNSMTNTNG